MSNCLIVLIAVIDIPHKSHIIKRLHSKQRSHHDDDHKNMWQNTFMNLLRAPQFRGQSSTKLSGLGRWKSLSRSTSRYLCDQGVRDSWKGHSAYCSQWQRIFLWSASEGEFPQQIIYMAMWKYGNMATRQRSGNGCNDNNIQGVTLDLAAPEEHQLVGQWGNELQNPHDVAISRLDVLYVVNQLQNPHNVAILRLYFSLLFAFCC